MSNDNDNDKAGNRDGARKNELFGYWFCEVETLDLGRGAMCD